MAEVLEIRPEGLQVYLRVPLEEIVLLKKALDKSSLKLNLKIPEEKEIHDYVHDNLYPNVKKLVEDLKDGS